MKVVIIGGGIAGLTLGILLKRRDYEVVINERYDGIPANGHAFLMHNEGYSLLHELGKEKGIQLPRKKVDTYSLRRPHGEEIKHLLLNSWKCIKRSDLINFLYSLFPAQHIKTGRAFSHFLYEGGKVTAAVFTNGEVEYGDVFIGSDGGNSKVRTALFGEVEFTAVEVKEVVGICRNEELAKQYKSEFTKFQHKNKGLAFGFIPTAALDEFVWFIQYDPTIADITSTTPDGLKSFCSEILSDFPPVVQQIINTNDFAKSYIWNTKDFDLLPSFHKSNVVLIGDAAHLAVPFTSAGTTNAIIDAKTLVECLNTYSNIETAFETYYQIRCVDVEKHVAEGRALKKLFLNPAEQNDDDIPVPLLPPKKEAEAEKEIEVLYFTDPICSTCWIIQPLLRKLKLEYDQYLNVKYTMGGLLPSWDGYNRGIISKPSDAAKHWEDVCATHEMPLDGDVWIEDPLPSSYPPSIAFKAAQMQDNDKAILFLRRIKEMLFLEKKNIIKWEYLEHAAFAVGLDSARLLRDFQGKAKERFKEDLMQAENLGVKVFPTLFFSNKKGECYTIRGYQPYDKFEAVIQKLLPGVQKTIVNTDPAYLFSQFSTMTEKEFALLSNIDRVEAEGRLQQLYVTGVIDKYESKNGVIWISTASDDDKDTSVNNKVEVLQASA